MPHATVLIDANNFYAACEQSLDPSLTGKPLVVLSNNDGCIVARSAEARALGIAMGTPYFKARQQLQQKGVLVRSSNYALYGDMSQRLMSLLEAHCEELEIYSIDEAFARLSRPAGDDLRPWARQLRALIRRNLGLAIAIGLGANKSQAKLANHLAKAIPAHAGVFDLLTTNDPDAWLDSIAIENVWGVGRKLSRWCRLRGINTARQLRDMPSSVLRAKHGVVGQRLQYELRGLTCLPLSLAPTPKQETCVSRSFSRPVSNLNELRQAIATYVVRASEKLRRQQQLAGALTVFTRTSPFSASFYSQAATIQLDLPSNDTGALLAAALPLVEKIFRAHRPLSKAGVLMQHLQSKAHLQQHLLVNTNSNDQQRRERLMTTIDRINQRYGNGTVRWAACGMQSSWSMRREKLSQATTTRLNHVPIVWA